MINFISKSCTEAEWEWAIIPEEGEAREKRSVKPLVRQPVAEWRTVLSAVKVYYFPAKCD